jgi:hypothetical protein
VDAAAAIDCEQLRPVACRDAVGDEPVVAFEFESQTAEQYSLG